jgi:hypothetical protein
MDRIAFQTVESLGATLFAAYPAFIAENFSEKSCPGLMKP